MSSEFGAHIQTVGYVSENYDHVSPFNDNFIYLMSMGITKETHGSDMVDVFQIMTGSTGNYIPPGKKSSSTGFLYDNMNPSGTDSIAFGGLTY
jgi:predicted molibdopterin-dependent oxidoreductase YjgC